MCSKHYQASVYIPKPRIFNIEKKSKIVKDKNKKKICDADNCDNPAIGLGYCSKHYARLRRHGDININYSLNNKKTRKQIVNTPLHFNHSYEEVMILNEFFNEAIDESISSYYD